MMRPTSLQLTPVPPALKPEHGCQCSIPSAQLSPHDPPREFPQVAAAVLKPLLGRNQQSNASGRGNRLPLECSERLHDALLHGSCVSDDKKPVGWHVRLSEPPCSRQVVADLRALLAEHNGRSLESLKADFARRFNYALNDREVDFSSLEALLNSLPSESTSAPSFTAEDVPFRRNDASIAAAVAGVRSLIHQRRPMGEANQPPVVQIGDAQRMRAALVDLLRGKLREAHAATIGVSTEGCKDWIDSLGRKNPPGGYFATYVKRDFITATGYELRQAQLGFGKLGDLLKSMHECCLAHQNKQGHMILYPPSQPPGQELSRSNGLAPDLRLFLAEQLMSYALLGQDLRLSQLSAQFQAQLSFCPLEAAGGSLALRAAVRAEAGQLVEVGEGADPVVQVRVDPVASLALMLRSKVAASDPSWGYPMECIKNDFRKEFGYFFQHKALGYRRLADLLADLMSHEVTARSNPRTPHCLVLVASGHAARPPREKQLEDLRRLLIEKMRQLHCATNRKDKDTATPAYYLGRVKPDFLRRFEYVFNEKLAGFQKMAAAVESQSDICAITSGTNAQRLLVPAPLLLKAKPSRASYPQPLGHQTQQPRSGPSVKRPLHPANHNTKQSQPPAQSSKAVVRHLEWEAERRKRHRSLLTCPYPQSHTGVLPRTGEAVYHASLQGSVPGLQVMVPAALPAPPAPPALRTHMSVGVWTSGRPSMPGWSYSS